MKALVVDDHALFREGMALLAEHRFPDLQLLQAGSLRAAIDLLGAHDDCRLVLLDLGLPDCDGVDGLGALRRAVPQAVTVVMSADERPETIFAAIDAGAAGYIPKTADGKAFEQALQAVLDGRVHLPPQVTGMARPPAAAPTSLELSPRQLDVLRLLIEGRSNKQIMRELELSESTVKTHLQAIFRRLGTSNRTQAVVTAARMGLRLSAAQVPGD